MLSWPRTPRGTATWMASLRSGLVARYRRVPYTQARLFEVVTPAGPPARRATSGRTAPAAQIASTFSALDAILKRASTACSWPSGSPLDSSATSGGTAPAATSGSVSGASGASTTSICRPRSSAVPRMASVSAACTLPSMLPFWSKSTSSGKAPACMTMLRSPLLQPNLPSARAACRFPSASPIESSAISGGKTPAVASSAANSEFEGRAPRAPAAAACPRAAP
mmetsp:Transcript_103390/g.267408  ORF Transcript_103390/g.267408 Transcript_103390/m.267408 type:complete len:224 (-) Transcript_103390:500-1171(-)